MATCRLRKKISEVELLLSSKEAVVLCSALATIGGTGATRNCISEILSALCRKGISFTQQGELFSYNTCVKTINENELDHIVKMYLLGDNGADD